jgi:hypothetical protein
MGFPVWFVQPPEKDADEEDKYHSSDNHHEDSFPFN